MFVTILLDFGQDYRVSLTPEEAHKVWMQLDSLFNIKPLTVTTDPGFFKPLGGNGWEATPDWNKVSTSHTEPYLENTEAKGEESPETLRDEAQHQCLSVKCWCGSVRYDHGA
jgi:hypothetical protein